MPWKTKAGTHYHMTEGCCGADILCGTAGLEPCAICCGAHAGDGAGGGTGAAGAGAGSPAVGGTGSPAGATGAPAGGGQAGDDAPGAGVTISAPDGTPGTVDAAALLRAGEATAAARAGIGHRRMPSPPHGETMAGLLRKGVLGVFDDAATRPVDGHRRWVDRPSFKETCLSRDAADYEGMAFARELAEEMTLTRRGLFGTGTELRMRPIATRVETHGRPGDASRTSTVTAHSLTGAPSHLRRLGVGGLLVTTEISCSGLGEDGRYGKVEPQVRVVPLSHGDFAVARRLVTARNGETPDDDRATGDGRIESPGCAKVDALVGSGTYDGCAVVARGRLEPSMADWAKLVAMAGVVGRRAKR